MKLKFMAAVLAGAGLLFSACAHAVPIIYTVSDTVGSGSVVGSIKTDGQQGILSQSDILDFNFTVSDGIHSASITSSNFIGWQLSGTGLTATPTDLKFDFGSTGFNVLIFAGPSSSGAVNTASFLCYINTFDSCDGTSPKSALSLHPNLNGPTVPQFKTFSGEAVIAFNGTEVVAQTPLPAALPLFATGLGALGLLGWRRKRKVAALAT